MILTRTLIVFFLCTLFITQSYANPINRKNADKHAQAGSRAAASGDWDTARRHWAKAVINGELGGIPDKHQAVFYYEYARSAGVTCFYEIAETYLNKAYELDKKINGPAFLSLVELFRLNLDQKKYQKAVSYFEQALPLFEGMNAASEAPAEFSKMLTEYAISLEGIGQLDKAKNIKERSNEVAKNAVKSQTERTPYATQCKQEL